MPDVRTDVTGIIEGPTEQVCQIQIVCLVTSDAEALALKARVTDALKGLAKKRFAFTLTDGNITEALRR